MLLLLQASLPLLMPLLEKPRAVMTTLTTLAKTSAGSVHDGFCEYCQPLLAHVGDSQLRAPSTWTARFACAEGTE